MIPREGSFLGHTMPKVPFDISKGWMPDIPPGEVAELGGLVRARNVMPVPGGYGPVKGYLTYSRASATITGDVLRGFLAKSESSGGKYNFFATSTGIYRFDRNNSYNLTYASKSPYPADYVSFCVYGNWLIATDFIDKPLVKYNMRNADLFAPLGGNPPYARYCILSHGHLVFANLRYNGESYPKQVMWSGMELPEDIDVDNPSNLATGADVQDLPDLDGKITGLVNLGDGWAVFAEKSITTAQYVGGTYRFSINRNAVKSVGCAYPGSLISIGDACFFWSKNSIWQYTLSGDLKDIGANLRETVVKAISADAAISISCTHDSINCVIYWTYSYADAPSVQYLIAYNYLSGHFTLIDSNCATVSEAATVVGLGGDPWVALTAANGYSVWEPVGGGHTGDFCYPHTYASFDSGSELAIVSISTAGMVKTPTGQNLICQLETGEVSDPETVVCVNKVFVPVER
jgi:hypothetical protein